MKFRALGSTKGSEDAFRNVRWVVAGGARREGKEEEDEEEIKQKTQPWRR